MVGYQEGNESAHAGLAAEQRTARLKKLSVFFGSKRLSTASPDGRVRVVTDGFGELISLSVAPAVLDDSNTANLGEVLVATIEEARNRAERLRVAGRAKMFPEASENS